MSHSTQEPAWKNLYSSSTSSSTVRQGRLGGAGYKSSSFVASPYAPSASPENGRPNSRQPAEGGRASAAFVQSYSGRYLESSGSNSRPGSSLEHQAAGSGRLIREDSDRLLRSSQPALSPYLQAPRVGQHSSQGRRAADERPSSRSSTTDATQQHQPHQQQPPSRQNARIFQAYGLPSSGSPLLPTRSSAPVPDSHQQQQHLQQQQTQLQAQPHQQQLLTASRVQPSKAVESAVTVGSSSLGGAAVAGMGGVLASTPAAGVAVDATAAMLLGRNGSNAARSAMGASSSGIRDSLGSSTTARPPSAQARGAPPQLQVGGHCGSRTNMMMLTSGDFGDEVQLVVSEESDETSSPYGGITLDQYMSRMVTTPASAAATSGLGQSSSSPGSPTHFNSREVGNGHAPDSPVISHSGGDSSSCDSPGISGTFTGGPPIGVALAGSADAFPGPPGMLARLPVQAPTPSSQLCGTPLTPSSPMGQRCRANSSFGESERSERTSGPATAWGSGAGLEDGVSGASALPSPSGRRPPPSRSHVASLMAANNNLDLRPATASAPSLSVGMGMHGQHGPGGGQHLERDHDFIKQVDLGGLAASLFTPSNDRASPSSLAAATSQGSLALPSERSLTSVGSAAAAAAAAAGLDAAHAGAGGIQLVDAAAGSRSGTTGGGAAVASPRAPTANSPKTGPSPSAWATRPMATQQPQHLHVDGGDGSGGAASPVSPGAALLYHQQDYGPRPPTRQVQSARPAGFGASSSKGSVEHELDPSVWEARIAVQLQRPPSRQKPPPEALHLWAPEQQFGRQVGRKGQQGQRPQTAAPATGTMRNRPQSGPSIKAVAAGFTSDGRSVARPPSRQKPPPMSLVLEHGEEARPGGWPGSAVGASGGARELMTIVSDDDSEFEY